MESFKPRPFGSPLWCDGSFSNNNTTWYSTTHGLRTPNEGINQRNLKFWADEADKICFGRTYKFGIGI